MRPIDLKAIPLFSGLSQEELGRLNIIFTPFSLPQDEVVIREGESGDEMYILIKGRVRITRQMLLEGCHLAVPGLESSRKVLATLDGRSFPMFGEVALLDNDIRSATVTTLEPCTFLKTNREQFFRLVAQDPALGCLLLTALGRKLANLLRRNNSELIKVTTALALTLSRQG